MVRDNESCRVPGCTVHIAFPRKTSLSYRNEQIREDWASGDWTVDELSSFWGLKRQVIVNIIRGVEIASESSSSLEVAHSL